MGRAVSIEPVSADVGRTLNEFGECAGLDDIAIRAAGVSERKVCCIVGGGEDDNGDRRETGIGPQAFQELIAPLLAKTPIEQNK